MSVTKLDGIQNSEIRKIANAGKLDRFFTDFFTGRGRGGWIWLDWVGLALTDSDRSLVKNTTEGRLGKEGVKTLKL